MITPGRWRWRRSALAASAPAAAQDAAGNWVGVLEVSPEIRLPLIVHIERGEAGAVTGTMDSPTQGVRGLPLTEIATDAGKLDFAVPAIGGTYKGHVGRRGPRPGPAQWSQNGHDMATSGS